MSIVVVFFQFNIYFRFFRLLSDRRFANEIHLFQAFWLTSVPDSAQNRDYESEFSRHQNFASEPIDEKFYTTAKNLVQQQVNFIARIEQAFTKPDINALWSVRGQLTIHVKSVEGFLNRQYQSPKTLCTSRADSATKVPLSPEQLTESQVKIYCSLYTSSQELLKLTPVLGRLLSRSDELALNQRQTKVREHDPFPSLGNTEVDLLPV